MSKKVLGASFAEFKRELLKTICSELHLPYNPDARDSTSEGYKEGVRRLRRLRGDGDE